MNTQQREERMEVALPLFDQLFKTFPPHSKFSIREKIHVAFATYLDQVNAAEYLREFHTLVELYGYVEQTAPDNEFLRLNDKGREALAAGGHSSFLLKQQQIAQRSELKHWYETENAKQVFEDYPNVKRTANISAIAAVVSAAIAVVAVLGKGCQ